jgi:molybdopterin-guanine dinucleotide biosynthesis protein B
LLQNALIPIIGVAAYSGTGKTTLLTRLVPILKSSGLRVALVKHAHHVFEVDKSGKDSYELRKAGASPVMVASRHRWALIMETPGQEEPVLDDLLAHLNQSEADVILVEGFKHERFPKIELYRPILGKPLLYPGDPSVLAIAADAVLPEPPPIPVLDLNRPDQIADFILQALGLAPGDAETVSAWGVAAPHDAQ